MCRLHCREQVEAASSFEPIGHPGFSRFTIGDTINSAQQIAQVACSAGCLANTPSPLATASYTAFGALSTLENGCMGSGCSNALETYIYNNRLQNTEIEVGTAGQNDKYSCLVYNYYYPSVPYPPTSCGSPNQANVNDNGDVGGYLYQDFVNPSLSHVTQYSYDPLNRLLTTTAYACVSAPDNCSPSSNTLYDLTFGYDPYGNMTCTESGSTQGPCPQLDYGTSSTTNQILTYAGNAVSYDAAGNLTNDGNGNTYQYDAEGRLSGTYNAFGWQVVGTPYSNFYDPSGLWLGNTYGTSILHFGRRIFAFEGGNQWQFIHENVLSSTAMGTDQTGNNVTGDLLFYPWGQQWPATTDCCEIHWAAFQWGGGSNLAGGSLFRTYNDSYGRWLTPDPAGLAAVDLTNPQSLNRYAYVRNNPTTLTDPLGLSPACLARSGGPFHARVSTGAGCPGVYEGGNGGVSIDGGGAIPAGLFGEGGLGGGGSAVQCPGNICEGLGTAADGTTAIVQFYAFANGMSGYYDPTDLTDGIYDYNGVLYNSGNYQALLKQVYAAQISGQCGTLSGNLATASGGAASVDCATVNYIQGGHANFPVTCGSWGTYDPDTGTYDCSGRFAGGLHIETNGSGVFWGHNDTASYYTGFGFNWGTFSPWNLFVHGTVDFIGGSLFTYVFGP
jgi:RHS repeat-associated protein